MKKLNDTELIFRISSSKGTYIRSLANDFGERPGVGGYLKELRRTRVVKFKLEGLNEGLRGIKFRILPL